MSDEWVELDVWRVEFQVKGAGVNHVGPFWLLREARKVADVLRRGGASYVSVQRRGRMAHWKRLTGWRAVAG